MASFAECLKNMIDADVISRDEARELGATFERLRTRHAAGMSPEAAEAAAREDMVKRLTAEASHKKRVALLTIAAQRRITKDLTEFRDARGDADIGLAAIDHLEHYGRAGFSSVEGRRKAILADAHAQLEGFMHHYRSTFLSGRRMNKLSLDNVVRERAGEASGDAQAKAFSDAIENVFEDLRQRFNAAGGAIRKLDRYILPQAHNPLALQKRGKDQWTADILPRLDPDRMVHPLTGDPVPAGELRAMLSHVYDSVVEDGWNERTPSAVPMGRGALYNQRADARFLVFKTADDWLAYQREYGNPDVFATVMNHVNGMSRDIAAMEVLGPNPNATIGWMKQMVQKEAALAENGKPSLMKAGRYPGKDIRGTANTTLAEIDGIWEQLRGGIGDQDQKLAAGFSGARNFLTAALLGGAVLPSMASDPVMLASAKKFLGLPAANTYWSLAKQFRPSARHEAVAAGLINEEAMHVLREEARYAGSLSGPEWTKWLPDRVITWQGLKAWTRAAKHAFGREMQAFAGQRLDQAWEDLPSEWRRASEGYGMGAAEWAVIRRARPQDMEGARFLRPQDIAALDDPRARELALRWSEMVLQETEYAVPSGTARGRAAVLGGTKAGSLRGEFWRSAAMFKSFGVSVTILQGARLAAEAGAGRGARGAAFAAATVGTLTLSGALGLWLRDIAAGRDPQKPQDGKFWIAAMLQGGGLGIFGDFLFADYSRYGNSFAATLAGPLVSLGEDVWKASGGQLLKLARGEETNLSEESIRMLRRYTPGGSLWYLRAAYNRVLLDTLQHWTDPKANQKFKRQAQNLMRERDQGFWWAPGEVAPSRTPQIGGR